MKKTVLFCIISMIIGMVAGYIVCQNTEHKLLNSYAYYNKATEALLDTLENEYNWVDAIDSYEYYDSRAKLDSLLDK